MDTKTKTFLAILAVILAVIIIYSLNDTPRSGSTATTQSDSSSTAADNNYLPAPEFNLKTISGKNLSLSKLRGKPLLLIFSATWCPSCIKESPILAKLYKEYKKDINFVGISLNSPINDVKNIIKKDKITYPILIGDDKIISDYGIQGIPALFFIDKKGNIIEKAEGALEKAVLRQKIENII